MAETDYQSLQDFLPLIETRLVEEEVVAHANQIVWALAGQDVPHYGPPRELILRFGAESPREGDGDTFQGSGSADRRVQRQLLAELRTRVQTDKAPDKTQALSDATRGHLQFEALVFDALDDWRPTAESELGETYELCPEAPMQWVSTDPPKEDQQSKDWAISVMTFKIPYIKDVTRNGSET